MCLSPLPSPSSYTVHCTVVLFIHYSPARKQYKSRAACRSYWPCSYGAELGVAWRRAGCHICAISVATKQVVGTSAPWLMASRRVISAPRAMAPTPWIQRRNSFCWGSICENLLRERLENKKCGSHMYCLFAYWSFWFVSDQQCHSLFSHSN